MSNRVVSLRTDFSAFAYAPRKTLLTSGGVVGNWVGLFCVSEGVSIPFTRAFFYGIKAISDAGVPTPNSSSIFVGEQCDSPPTRIAALDEVTKDYTFPLKIEAPLGSFYDLKDFFARRLEFGDCLYIKYD
jgi:hypothetical protein